MAIVPDAAQNRYLDKHRAQYGLFNNARVLTPDVNGAPVKSVLINCTITGTVVLNLLGGSVVTITAPVGQSTFKEASVIGVSSASTATATYTGLA